VPVRLKVQLSLHLALTVFLAKRLETVWSCKHFFIMLALVSFLSGFAQLACRVTLYKMTENETYL